jgi:plastocyanin
MNKKIVIAAVVLIVIIILGIVFVPQVINRFTNNTRKQVKLFPPEKILNVSVTNKGFSPATITIKAGEAITWTNVSTATAQIDSDPHPIHNSFSGLNLASFPAGGKVQTTFTKPGTYKYHNEQNLQQTGTVIVK